MAEKKQTFENSLGEMERIVRELEDGDLALEKSLELFERGVGLARSCQQRLNEAERRIEALMRDSEGKPALEEIGEATEDQ
jgi:exodeoxyribonuclease VII small subunit